eukprot:gene2670-8519_t
MQSWANNLQKALGLPNGIGDAGGLTYFSVPQVFYREDLFAGCHNVSTCSRNGVSYCPPAACSAPYVNSLSDRRYGKPLQQCW